MQLLENMTRNIIRQRKVMYNSQKHFTGVFFREPLIVLNSYFYLSKNNIGSVLITRDKTNNNKGIINNSPY